MVGLDAKGMRQVRGLFRELADGGSTVLLSTHTMSIAEEVCDRIGILSSGALVAEGSLDELRQKLEQIKKKIWSLFFFHLPTKK